MDRDTHSPGLLCLSTGVDRSVEWLLLKRTLLKVEQLIVERKKSMLLSGNIP